MRDALGLLLLLLLGTVGAASAATIAGKEAKPGPLVEIQFPVSKYFQDMAANGGNPRPQTGRAVLSFPPGFDLSRRWPILIVTSTTDFNRTSPMDAFAYKPIADGEGWVILASDATIKAKFDSTPAALDVGRSPRPDAQELAAK